jgi:SAM-dependent methyltransferase
MNLPSGDNQEMTNEPLKTRMFRILWRLSGRRQKVDALLSSFLKYRKYLPECDAADVIPDFSNTVVHIQQCPLGAWSTPLVDVYVVLKAALGFHSKRILELGSYRGETARMLAENTGDDVRIFAVDIDERHGSAYQGLELARKIVRKTGHISVDLLGAEEKYDLIFVDANHDFDSVMNDTEVAFKVLAKGGVILWHDYALENYFMGMNGVPEALNHFARTRPLYAIRGTRLAMFSDRQDWPASANRAEPSKAPGKTVWDERQMRG